MSRNSNLADEHLEFIEQLLFYEFDEAYRKYELDECDTKHEIRAYEQALETVSALRRLLNENEELRMKATANLVEDSFDDGEDDCRFTAVQ